MVGSPAPVRDSQFEEGGRWTGLGGPAGTPRQARRDDADSISNPANPSTNAAAQLAFGGPSGTMGAGALEIRTRNRGGRSGTAGRRTCLGRCEQSAAAMVCHARLADRWLSVADDVDRMRQQSEMQGLDGDALSLDLTLEEVAELAQRHIGARTHRPRLAPCPPHKRGRCGSSGRAARRSGSKPNAPCTSAGRW